MAYQNNSDLTLAASVIQMSRFRLFRILSTLSAIKCNLYWWEELQITIEHTPYLWWISEDFTKHNWTCDI